VFSERSYKLSCTYLRIAVTFFLLGSVALYFACRLRRVVNRTITARRILCELIENFRDEREGEFHGADDEEHERLERAEREALR